MDHNYDIMLTRCHHRSKGRALSYSLFIVLSILLPSCSPKIIERVVYQHDTTQVVRIDSVWQYQHDSVYVREKGDTVYQYVEKIRYRDRFKVDTLVSVREVHDTTTIEKKVEKELSWAQKAKINAFPWVLLVAIGLTIWTTRKWWMRLVK